MRADEASIANQAGKGQLLLVGVCHKGLNGRQVTEINVVDLDTV
jgi:hypothetical protein